jgi:CHAT domain-containing protein
LTVGNPRYTPAPSLEWAEAEAEAIVTLARGAGRSASRALVTTDATKPAVMSLLRTVRESYQGAWVEIAGHGYADPARLGKAYMLLGGVEGGPVERLTLAELQQDMLLRGARLVNASGCITAVGDLDVAPDELSSLAAGLLQSGAASAVATQWSVEDRATFLFMLRFAQVALGTADVTPAHALRDAARWLRRATWAELDALAQQGLRKLRPIQSGQREDRVGLRGLSRDDPTRDVRFSAQTGFEALAVSIPAGRGREQPFAHPIYWAAVVIFGA